MIVQIWNSDKHDNPEELLIEWTIDNKKVTQEQLAEGIDNFLESEWNCIKTKEDYR